MSSGKCILRSGGRIFKIPELLTISKSSSGLNSPKRSPLFSTLILETVSSNQIFLGLSVESPFSLNKTLFIEYFVTMLPLTDLPLIDKSPKSRSHFSFFTDPDCLN